MQEFENSWKRLILKNWWIVLGEPTKGNAKGISSEGGGGINGLQAKECGEWS